MQRDGRLCLVLLLLFATSSVAPTPKNNRQHQLASLQHQHFLRVLNEIEHEPASGPQTASLDPSTQLVSLNLFFADTGGNDWLVSTGWDDSDNICGRFGISCLNNTWVTGITLTNNQLTGVLSDAHFAHLPYLQLIRMDSNALSGPLPAFATAPLLSYIELASNAFTGVFPTFDQLTELTYLSIAYCSIEGGVPVMAANPALQFLSVGGNNLTGLLPAYENLQALSALIVTNCRLTGTVPDFNLSSLVILILSNNQLHGMVPAFAHLPQLRELQLDGNLFDSLDDGLAQRTSLTYLDLSDNDIVLVTWPNLFDMPSLTVLLLRSNAISLRIHTGSRCAANAASQLTVMDLSFNLIEGEVIQVLECFRILTLDELDLSSNLITTSLNYSYPTQFVANSSTLVHLNLANNRLFNLAVIRLLNSFYVYSLLPLLAVLNVTGNPFPVYDAATADPNIKSAFHFLVADPVTFYLDPNSTAFYQPLIARSQTVILDPYVLGYAYALCPTGYFWNQRLSKCQPCPEHCTCFQPIPAAILQNQSIQVDSGWYPVSTGTGTVARQVDLSESDVVYLPCEDPFLCAPVPQYDFQCGPGYDPESFLCSSCLPDHYFVGEQCVPCRKSYPFVIPLVMASSISLFGVWAYTRNFNPESGSARVSIFFFYLQVTTILSSQLAGPTQTYSPASARLLWISQLDSFWAIQSVINFRPWAFECYSHALRQDVAYMIQFWILWTIPTVCFVVVLLAALCRLDTSSDPVPVTANPMLDQPGHAANEPMLPPPAPAPAVEATSRQRILFIFYYVLDVAYFPFIVSMLQLFPGNCMRAVAGTHTFHYLRSAPYLSCDRPGYHAMEIAALVGTVFIGVGVPVWLNYSVWKVSHEADPNQSPFRFVFGFLWEALRSSQPIANAESVRCWNCLCGEWSQSAQKWWWRVRWGYARKIAIAAILATCGYKNLAIPLLVLTVLIIYFGSVAYVKPYRLREDVLLEMVTVGAAFGNYWTSILSTLGQGFFQGLGWLIAVHVISFSVKVLIFGYLFFHYGGRCVVVCNNLRARYC